MEKIIKEPTTIGLSENMHTQLQRLKDDEHFGEMLDAYRFAIALALAYKVIPPEISLKRKTIYGVGTVDPNREIAIAIKSLIDVQDIPIYTWAERLAEWGVDKLRELTLNNKEIDFENILNEINNISNNSQ